MNRRNRNTNKLAIKMKKIIKKMASRRKWFKQVLNKRRKPRKRRKAIPSIARSMPKYLLPSNKPLHPMTMRVCKRKKSREMLTSYQLPFSKSLPNPVQRLRSKLLLHSLKT